MIRKACVDDASRIAEIHVFGWRCAYRSIITDEYLFAKASVIKRIDAFRNAIVEDVEEIYVFEETNIIKAFMTIGKCRNEDKSKSFELWGIYVEPLLTGNGIGTRMVEFCEEKAIERGYKENVLWVFQDNIKARRFYEKMGYKEDGKEEVIERFNTKEIRYVKELKDTK